MINLPVPNDINHKGLSQLLRGILIRALDVSINPAIMTVGLKVVGNDITVDTPGNGFVVWNRSGTQKYRILVEDNGALSNDPIP